MYDLLIAQASKKRMMVRWCPRDAAVMLTVSPHASHGKLLA